MPLHRDPAFRRRAGRDHPGGRRFREGRHPAICDEYAAKYPTIVKAIHQENGGHGEGVNQGIRNATGLYYKVVDSDDWLDTDALQKVLAR